MSSDQPVARRDAIRRLAAELPPMTDAEIAAAGSLAARLDEAAAALGRGQPRAS